LSARPTVRPDHPWLGVRVRPAFQENFSMKASVSASSFRPTLEALEGRDLPSSVGFALVAVVNQINTTTGTMATLLNGNGATTAPANSLQGAQNKLTSDIATVGAPTNMFGTFANNTFTPTSLTLFNAAIANDYSKAGSLFGQIKTLNTEVSDLNTIKQNLTFAAFSGDQFDKTVAFVTFSGANGSTIGSFLAPFLGIKPSTTTMTASQLFTTATNIINTAQTAPYPSIGTGANV
jgi:hypothetical protein